MRLPLLSSAGSTGLVDRGSLRHSVRRLSCKEEEEVAVAATMETGVLLCSPARRGRRVVAALSSGSESCFARIFDEFRDQQGTMLAPDNHGS
jgi:hypothetical protein